MTWQTEHNSTDGGIFAMAHLATYMGWGADHWRTSLVPESVSLYSWTILFNSKKVQSLFIFSNNIISLLFLTQIEQLKQLDHLRYVFADQLLTSSFNELRDVFYQQIEGQRSELS